jgi:hypothetical protein
MTFGGDLSLGPDGGMDIDIRIRTLGSVHDQVTVAGTASLAGVLNISLNPNVPPTAGDKFEILTAASVLGEFDSVNGPPLPDDLMWFVNYHDTSVELVSTYGADFDENGVVDKKDLGAWEEGFGSTPAAHMDGDANADALANGFDFLKWQQQYGSGGAILAASTTVPEPGTALLLVLAIFGFGLVNVNLAECHGSW